MLLSRLRTSTRLAVLVLLIFALKIGAAAACAQLDFADTGVGTKAPLGAVMKAPATDGPDALTRGSLAAGACSHCSCHHALMMVPDTQFAFAVTPHGRLVVVLAGVPPSASSRMELRPPIV